MKRLLSFDKHFSFLRKTTFLYKLTMPQTVMDVSSPKKICLEHSGAEQTLTTLSRNFAPKLKYAKLTEHASTPTKGSASAAGFDLYSAYDHVVPAKGKVLVKTDIQIACPDGCYGRIAPRSGLAHKHFIDVGAGVIDQDYRGNVGVILFNHGEKDFPVTKGDRIAQLILERIYLPELEELPTLDETVRGADGFGSSGGFGNDKNVDK